MSGMELVELEMHSISRTRLALTGFWLWLRNSRKLAVNREIRTNDCSFEIFHLAWDISY